MKKIFSFSSAAVLLGTLFLASCAKEEEEPIPAKFQGNWFVNEKSKDFGASTYNLTIADSSYASYVLMAYLYGFNKKVFATVSGNNLSIPGQIVQGNNVSGNGTLTSANRMDLKYFVKTTSTHYDTVTAVLTK